MQGCFLCHRQFSATRQHKASSLHCRWPEFLKAFKIPFHALAPHAAMTAHYKFTLLIFKWQIMNNCISHHARMRAEFPTLGAFFLSTCAAPKLEIFAVVQYSSFILHIFWWGANYSKHVLLCFFHTTSLLHFYITKEQFQFFSL